MTTKTPTLRPASELTAEREAKKAARQTKDFSKYLADAVRLIEEAHRKGQHSVCSLTFPDAIVKELRANGYRVKYRPACGMGDVDSHEISWL